MRPADYATIATSHADLPRPYEPGACPPPRHELYSAKACLPGIAVRGHGRYRCSECPIAVVDGFLPGLSSDPWNQWRATHPPDGEQVFADFRANPCLVLLNPFDPFSVVQHRGRPGVMEHRRRINWLVRPGVGHPAVRAIHPRAHELRREERHDCIAVAPQESHSTGNPMSQRE